MTTRELSRLLDLLIAFEQSGGLGTNELSALDQVASAVRRNLNQ